MIRSLLVCMLVVAAVSPVHADGKSEAILLFDRGINEMKAGNFEKACKSFEESIARFPDSGTKGSLAKCYEKLGKLATSWLLWRELADTAPTANLRKDAANQAAKLDPKVPKYVVKVVAQTPGLQLMVNGKSAGLTDLPVPIDSGPVVAIASAPDHKEWKADLTAADGSTLVIEVPALVAIQKTDIKRPDDNKPNPGRSRRIIGFAVIGAGAAAAVVGGVFGISARSKFADAKETCGGSIDSCIPERLVEAQGQVDDSRKAANLSSILFGAGGALILTGVIVVVTAPSGRAAETKPPVAIAPMASPDSAGFVVSGRF